MAARSIFWRRPNFAEQTLLAGLTEEELTDLASLGDDQDL